MAATLTDRFVFVHLPKTGGSFVSKMLHDVYRVRRDVPRFSLTRLRRALTRGDLSGRREYGALRRRAFHPTCEELDAEIAGRPVLGVVRNPFDWYVSAYKFTQNAEQAPQMTSRFTTFAADFFKTDAHSFEDFLRHVWKATETNTGRGDLGQLTMLLARFYFRDWKRVCAGMEPGYFSSGRYREDMYDVRMLHTERINDELADYLLELGYRPEHVEPIRTHPRVLPPRGGRPEGDRWQNAYTPDLLEETRHRERFLLEWMPRYASSD